MNIFQLTCFLAVAETLNFARASELLNITQPAVTHQIHTLETELNVKLFHRTTRTVELTPAGQIFLGDAQSMVSISERAKNRFKNPSDQEIQTLSLGCHVHGQLFLLPEVLRRLTQRYPSLHPRLHVVPFKHLYRMLAEDDIDAILAFQAGASKKMPFVYQELGRVPMAGYCAGDHPLAGRSSLTRADLERETLILHDPRKSPDPMAELQLRLIESHPVSKVFFCASEEEALTLAQAGLGLAFLPGLPWAGALPLARVPIADVSPLSFGLYYKTLAGNPLLKDFVRLAKEELRFS